MLDLGISHSNAIIIWPVRYTVSLLQIRTTASHFTWIPSARSHTAREAVRWCDSSVLRRIQGVPGGMCQTSGECSLG